MINNKKEGYFLIETLIYVILSSLFIILLFKFLVIYHLKYKNSYKKTNTQYWSSLDLMFFEIIQTNKIDLIEKNKIIISTHNKDIGWYVKDNKLYRIEGQYDKKQSNWDKQSIQSVALYNINEIRFKLEKNILKIYFKAQKGGNNFEFEKLIFIRARKI